MKIRKLKISMLIGFILIFPTLTFAQDNSTLQNKKTIYDLIHRLLPKKIANQFEISFISKVDDKDVFEIESVDEKIVLRGNNGVSIASALNFYLKNYAHCQITWNGTNLDMPNPLPKVLNKVQRKSPYKYRYYLNYCTFNYTMSWWKWDRWQKEIDWMALNGINMPLALTGQNSIWKRVYNSLGFTDKDLESFFSGPAYFNWFWMGNIDGWGGPLPQSFMVDHEMLQKKILNQERLFGMTPVLPAFTGHVPPTFSNRFPNVKLKQTAWSTFPKVSLLDPSEPMFTEIGNRFMKELINTFGTNHLYSADTFNENTPPTNDSMYLNDVSNKVYQSMAIVDPQATWIMQGWLFHHGREYWKPQQIKALLNAVPNDKMIVLDLYSERFPIWKSTESYYGKPWIWNMLHNFGQNINLSGLMSSISKDPVEALNNSQSKITGIGLTMEGIEQNPVIYDLMLENVWRDTPIELESWLNEYALRRYGKKNSNAENAWKLLSRSVYADSLSHGGAESIITGRPTFKINPGGYCTTILPYNPLDLVKAWSYMISASNVLKESDGFQFDVVDITRQVLADYASIIQQQTAKDYKNKDIKSFNQNSQSFMELISDLDNLLSTRKDFLLGNWIHDARKWGNNQEERKLYEKNARTLITLWGDKNSKLHGYACKQWAGMLNGYYAIRWKKFFNKISQDMSQNKEFDQKQFDDNIKEWELAWIVGDETYTIETKGNSVKTAKMLYTKYFDIIYKSYSQNNYKNIY